MTNPFITVVAVASPWGCSVMENSWLMSSSYPFSSSKKPNHWCIIKMFTTWGCWWILLVSVGSLILPLIGVTQVWDSIFFLFFKAISVVETMLNSFISVRLKDARIDIKQTLFLCFYPEKFLEIPPTAQLSIICYQFQVEFSCKWMENEEGGFHLLLFKIALCGHDGLETISGHYGSLSPFNSSCNSF